MSSLLQHRVIPVVEIESAGNAVPLANALLQSGISVIEVTLRTDAAVDSIAQIREFCPDMLVGAGTVIRPEQANEVIRAGAQFGVAPGFNPAICELFANEDLDFIPGVITPGEIESALAAGYQYLKFFPAGAAGGTSYLKAVSGPYLSSGVRFCATGGVNINNMTDYLELPIVQAVGGSWLATREQINNQCWGEVSNQVQNTMQQVSALKSA